MDRILRYPQNKSFMLAPPGGNISNLMASIIIVFELMNNFIEDVISLSSQVSEMFAKHLNDHRM